MVNTMAIASNMNDGGNLKKKAPVKVKQDMIDFIKTQGMTKALKRAGEIKASGKGGEAEFLEGVRRMYGASRLSAATKTSTPTKLNAPAGANKKPASRLSKSSASVSTKFDAKKAASTSLRAGNAKASMDAGRGVSSTKPKPKPAVKKSTTTDPLARAVFGVTKKVGAAFTPDWKKKEAAKKAAKNK